MYRLRAPNCWSAAGSSVAVLLYSITSVLFSWPASSASLRHKPLRRRQELQPRRQPVAHGSLHVWSAAQAAGGARGAASGAWHPAQRAAHATANLRRHRGHARVRPDGRCVAAERGHAWLTRAFVTSHNGYVYGIDNESAVRPTEKTVANYQDAAFLFRSAIHFEQVLCLLKY